MRLGYNDGSKGTLREIKAGSGHWSQNSYTQVLGTNGNLKQIEVRWFDGRRQTVDAIADQKNYVINYPQDQ